MLIGIDKIIIKDRIRKDFGNIEELAKDIDENGLINPPVVVPLQGGTFMLLAGERRLRALKSLGKKDVEVRTWANVTDEEALNIEISENEVRKDFSKAERIEYAKKLERIEAAKAEARMKAGVSNPKQKFGKGRATDTVAEKLGIGSGETYRKEKTIVEHKDLISVEDFQEWDEGKLSTNKAYQRVKAELSRQQEQNRVEVQHSKTLGDILKKANARIKELESREPEVREVKPADYDEVKAVDQLDNKNEPNWIDYVCMILLALLTFEGLQERIAKRRRV